MVAAVSRGNDHNRRQKKKSNLMCYLLCYFFMFYFIFFSPSLPEILCFGLEKRCNLFNRPSVSSVDTSRSKAIGGVFSF